MTIPKPEKLAHGYRVRIIYKGKTYTFHDSSSAGCTQQAKEFKAKCIAGMAPKDPKKVTLNQAIDSYINVRSNILSPVTIRSYRIVQRKRFQSVMNREISSISHSEWQGLVNLEARSVGYRVIKNSVGFIRSVCSAQGFDIGKIVLPTPTKADKPFLTPDQIRVFVTAVADTQYAVPALLALSSLRISEICALRWEDIPKKPDFIQVKGAVVPNEHNKFVFKKENKNLSSMRKVPILIPELKIALERDRKEEGPVLDMRQNSFYEALTKIYKKNNLPQVGIHGLRHSFASLCYHLQVPERITMEIGGWSDRSTMDKIYTHIAKNDITRYEGAILEYYKSSTNPPQEKVQFSK